MSHGWFTCECGNHYHETEHPSGDCPACAKKEEEMEEELDVDFEHNYPFEVGDIVLIQHAGHGFVDADKGKYVVVVGYGDYFGEAGLLVKEYDSPIMTRNRGNGEGVVGYGSFGKKPLILFNIHEEHVVDEEHTVVAVGSKEEADKILGIDRSVRQDMVNKPSHYQLFHKDDIEGDFIEVKHVVKAVLQSWEDQDKISFDFYQAGCYKELLQYLLRAPLKNNIEDVQKAEYYLKEIINEW